MLELEGVRQRYGRRTVLEIERFALTRGAAVALVGPNGAGKSTLLRVLACLETPAAGAVRLDGQPAGRQARRRVTLVEQRPFLFRGTVAQNLEFGLAVRREPRGGRRARAAAAAERLGVAHLLDRRARDLSEGEVQRVAVARAFALEPDVLLLDEPLSSADRAASALLYRVLEEERGRRQLTVCLASHQLDDAYRWTTDVRALAEGRLTPVTPENLFRTELRGEGETKCARLERAEIVVMTDRTGPTILGVPPADILISRAPFDSSARNSLEGRVLRIVERAAGGGVAVTVDAGVELTALLTHAAVRELALTPGDVVVLSFKASAVRVF